MGCSQTARINRRIPITQFKVDDFPIQVTNSIRLQLDSYYKTEIDTHFRILSKALVYPKVVNGNIVFDIKENLLTISSTDGTMLKSYKYKLKKDCLAFKEVDNNIVIPFLYANRHLSKFRLYQTQDGKTLLWCRYINEGMLLFFGAGNTHDLTFELIE